MKGTKKKSRYTLILALVLLVAAAAGLGLGLGLQKKDDPPPVVRTQVTSVLRFEISASNFSTVDIGSIAAAGAQVSYLPGPTSARARAPAPHPLLALQRLHKVLGTCMHELTPVSPVLPGLR